MTKTRYSAAEVERLDRTSIALTAGVAPEELRPDLTMNRCCTNICSLTPGSLAF